ncbi:MAG: phosphatidylserine decarboxylase family protein [Acidobacteria bacterium]|nr:phosphatidylserine decarboxylase family protein [Acidobacteriota bacterium]
MVATGIYYAVALIAAGYLAGYFTRPWLGLPFYILALFCLWFFRDPNREVPQGPVAVSPADGKVVSIKDIDGKRTRISIFLNVFDVHVNRTPVEGVVRSVHYRKGKFGHAEHAEASEENERNEVSVEMADGAVVTFTQIAGLIARRIVCDKKPGDRLERGERIGLIKFGSRVDVFLGPEWQIAVQVGDRVSAASSIIAKRRGS